MDKEKDPMGTAVADYFDIGVAGRLRVFSPGFDEDRIPLHVLFRTFEEMPLIERQALQLSRGRVLDVGAGAGCHSLVLQDMGLDVEAIDISPLCVDTMRRRGVRKVSEQDFWSISQRYDTILMLMNGIGIVGSLKRMPEFFAHVRTILADGGQLVIDSTDISYLFEIEDGIIDLPDADRYYGEIDYQMQYGRIKGEPFSWLYIDPDTLDSEAEQNGFVIEKLIPGDEDNYLAVLRIND